MGDCFSQDGTDGRWVTFKFYTTVASSPTFEYHKPLCANYFQMKNIVFNGFERYIYNRYRTLYGNESKKNKNKHTKRNNENNNETMTFAQAKGQSNTITAFPNQNTNLIANLGNFESTNSYVTTLNQKTESSNINNDNNNENNENNDNNSIEKISRNYKHLKTMFLRAKTSDIFIDKFITFEYKVLKVNNQFELPILVQSSSHWDFVRKKSDLMFYVKIECSLFAKYHKNGAYVLAQLVNDYEYLENHPKLNEILFQESNKYENDNIDNNSKKNSDKTSINNNNDNNDINNINNRNENINSYWEASNISNNVDNLLIEIDSDNQNENGNEMDDKNNENDRKSKGYESNTQEMASSDEETLQLNSDSSNAGTNQKNYERNKNRHGNYSYNNTNNEHKDKFGKLKISVKHIEDPKSNQNDTLKLNRKLVSEHI